MEHDILCGLRQTLVDPIIGYREAFPRKVTHERELATSSFGSQKEISILEHWHI